MSGFVQIFSNVGDDDSAYFAAWRDSFRREGWDVEVVSSVPGGEYRNARSFWRRLILRWKMYPGFAIRIAMACLLRREGVRIVTTNPFFAPWLAKCCSGSRACVVMLLYDLYPDALEVGLATSGPRLMHRLMAHATRSAIRGCDAVVYLGDRLRQYAEERYGPSRKSAVIPVGADESQFDGAPSGASDPRREIGILYCGQMGRMHELDTLAALFEHPADLPGIRFRFHSSGQNYWVLQDRCRSATARGWQINWGGPLALADWGPTMKQADIGLVTLRPGAERVAMPSKTYSAMAAGQAILAIAPSDSDLADLVRRHDCGWVIETGDVQALKRMLEDISANPAEVYRMRGNAFRAAREFYEIPIVQQSWSRLLAKFRSA